jgi:hypothetical protein
MHLIRRFILATALLAGSSCFADKAEDWLPITQQDLQLKEVPGKPGSAAVQLFYEDFDDDGASSSFFYHRIKVLTDQGRQFADVEIPLGNGFSVVDLKARTIHPDGKIVDFTAKPFDTTLVKAHGVRIHAKKFTLAEVTVGSIIEYKYRITWEAHIVRDTLWVLQQDLFTVKELFRIKPYRGPLDIQGARQSYAYLNMVNESVPQKKGDLWELQLENMPAFDPEEYMPPEDDYKPQIRFYYGGKEVASPDAFWEAVAKALGEITEREIGNYREVKDIAVQAIGGEIDAEKKLRRLYARAQQLRNLSFERERDAEEARKDSLKPNGNIADALKRGYGTHDDINRLFVGLARAAGFDASIVWASNRELRSFKKEILSLRQLDSTLASVNLNGKDLFLDPGTKYCPYGLVRWMRTSVPALAIGKHGGALVTTPTTNPEDSVVHRVANVALDATGLLKGEVTLEFSGEDALEHRLDALQTDETGRTKELEHELVKSFPEGASAKLLDMQGMEESEKPLIARFSVEIPGFASVAGKHLVVPVCIFQTRTKNPFVHDMRTYPIAFPYSSTELDDTIIRVPAGYTLESPAHPYQMKLYYATYQTSIAFEDNQIKSKRVLTFKGVHFGPEQYSQLKGFFNVVQVGDSGQAVLQEAAAASLKKQE